MLSEFPETNGMAFEELAKTYLNIHRGTWAPKTTRRKISALRAWGRHEGHSEFLAGYRAPTPPRPEPHPIPEGVNGVLEMIQAAEGNIEGQALLALCGLVGARVSEALAAHSFDLNYVNQTIRLRGKGDKYRIVPVSNLALKFIHPATKRGGRLVPMPDRTARRFITRMAAQCHLTRPVASHDLRATFATAAYERSKDIRVVQELLGHASAQTTEVYTGITQARMRDACKIAGD